VETHRFTLSRLSAPRGASASSAYCLLYLDRFLAWNNFAEAAVLAIRSLLLIEKRQLALVESLEPLIPADFSQ
jgi:hypothetical protein